jgi:hypothetical protein
MPGQNPRLRSSALNREESGASHSRLEPIEIATQVSAHSIAGASVTRGERRTAVHARSATREADQPGQGGPYLPRIWRTKSRKDKT